MAWLSFSNILITLGIVYFAYTASSLYELFQSPACQEPSSKCLKSLFFINNNPPKLEVRVTFSTNPNVDASILLKRRSSLTIFPLPISQDTGIIMKEIEPVKVNVSIPASVRQKNGTFYAVIGLIAIVSDGDHRILSWDADAITKYAVPKAETVNLLGDSAQSEKISEKPQKVATNYTRPCTHWNNRLHLMVTNDLQPLPPVDELPPDFQGLVHKYRHSDGRQYYIPPIHIDRLVWREKELVKVKQDDTELPLEIELRASTLGRMRFRFTIYQSLMSMKTLGFADHDLDDVKSLFADTSLWLLLLTVFVSTLHLIFDFLAFKNDVSFWRNRRTTSGISTRGLVWRAVSSFIVMLYLVDESASLLVTAPMALSVVIELWKLTRALHIRRIGFGGFERAESTKEEKQTDAYDAQAMGWLGLLMVPLLLGCAVYSLMYVPHRSWYSWTITSLVNAVYAFGFLFMLPQLFINFRLKSVANLPWRVFIYRALNTFIDDLFAFIISMPTAHRVACFRDDIVFVIYLYQRYLYPVDHTRPTEMPDESSTATEKAPEAKKTD